MASADFDQAIAESHAATDGVLKGNPDGFKALYSRSEDITLGNPFGGFARGWDQVVEQLERASSYYRDGEATGFESVARAVGSELAYTVELERAKAKVRAAPTSGSSLFELRRSIATKRTVGDSSIVMPIPGSPADRRVRARSVGAYRSQSRTAMPKRTYLVLRDAQTPRRSH